MRLKTNLVKLKLKTEKSRFLKKGSNIFKVFIALSIESSCLSRAERKAEAQFVH